MTLSARQFLSTCYQTRYMSSNAATRCVRSSSSTEMLQPSAAAVSGTVSDFLGAAHVLSGALLDVELKVPRQLRVRWAKSLAQC